MLMRTIATFVALIITLILGGCAGSLPASVAGGECRIFAPPDYAIRGKTQLDQNWIDDTEEAGIAGCKWSRPKARPAPVARISNAAPHKAVPIPPVKSTAVAPPPVKKHWWQRSKKAPK